MALDTGRLRRAVHLAARIVAPGVWRVEGGREPHTVTVGGGVARCDCADAARRRDGVCKHRLAVVLATLPASVLEGLRTIVGRAE